MMFYFVGFRYGNSAWLNGHKTVNTTYLQSDQILQPFSYIYIV